MPAQEDSAATRAWQEATADYLEILRVERGLAAHTLAAYRRDLADFAAFAAARQVEPAGVTRPLILAYLHQLERAGRSRATAARRLAALRGFFRYLASEGKVEHDPAEGMATPRGGRPLPRVLAVDEVERVLELPQPASPAGLRDRAVLELLYATGLRVSELVGLDLDDLLLDHGLLRCRGKGARSGWFPWPRRRWKPPASTWHGGGPPWPAGRASGRCSSTSGAGASAGSGSGTSCAGRPGGRVCPGP